MIRTKILEKQIRYCLLRSIGFIAAVFCLLAPFRSGATNSYPARIYCSSPLGELTFVLNEANLSKAVGVSFGLKSVRVNMTSEEIIPHVSQSHLFEMVAFTETHSNFKFRALFDFGARLEYPPQFQILTQFGGVEIQLNSGSCSIIVNNPTTVN